jgi:hypothetical protein
VAGGATIGTTCNSSRCTIIGRQARFNVMRRVVLEAGTKSLRIKTNASACRKRDELPREILLPHVNSRDFPSSRCHTAPGLAHKLARVEEAHAARSADAVVSSTSEHSRYHLRAD